MGKRELLLIVGFLIAGVILYEVSAPATAPGASFGGIIQNIKRHLQGNRATAEAHSTATQPVGQEVRELRMNLGQTDLTIAGEDRNDIAADLTVSARGYDDAEARQAADAYKLGFDAVPEALILSLGGWRPPAAPGTAVREKRLENRSGPARLTLSLKVPRRLRLRLEPFGGRLQITGVAAVDAMGSRGDVKIANVAERVSLTHAAGPLALDHLGALKLNARGSRGSIDHVDGLVSIESVSGELTISDVKGPIDIQSRGTDYRLESLAALQPPVKIDAVSGRLRIDGLRTEARIDGRNTEIDVTLARAAPVTIYSSNEDIDVTAPPGGYTLDAIATEGRLSVSDGDLAPTGDDNGKQVKGPVRGGGPTITLRATRAGITLRAAASGK
jgi:hypothetical protein